MKVIKSTVNINTVTIGNIDFCNSGIFILSATLNTKNRDKFIANPTKT